MKIGIDISQTAYANTGVANYLTSLIEHLIKEDQENEYILFFSSMRKTLGNGKWRMANRNVKIKKYKLPPGLLDFLWNKMHICPIEWFIGPVDIFITSDWTEPPAIKAKKMAILYDLIVYTHPDETAANIVATQKRKLAWAKKEESGFLCISESTKKDAEKILGIAKEKLFVIHPGIN